MNTPLLVIVGFLIVVLIAVSAGATGMTEQASARVAAMEQELKAALEMRDAAVREVAVLKVEMVNRDQQIAQWQEKYASLDAHVRKLDAIIVDLQGQIAVAQGQPQIPVTGGLEGPRVFTSQCLLSRAAAGQVGGSLLAVVAGVAALGSGWAVKHTGGRGGNQKITVRMTRSQLEEYIRYQRQAGNRVQ